MARQAAGLLYRRRGDQFRSGRLQAAARTGRATGFPITSTLMGLGAYPASDKQWLGMLGMHGTYEANMAMHDCDVMIYIGARFDDRITGRTMPFRRVPRRSTSISTRRRSTRRSRSMFPIIGDVGHVLEEMVRLEGARPSSTRRR
jgi:acetolactate synthase-1/2/3 large subunit